MDNINDRRYFELFNISDKYLIIEEKNDGPNNDDNSTSDPEQTNTAIYKMTDTGPYLMEVQIMEIR